MGPIPPRVLASRLRRLDSVERAAFVAALWSASGSKVTCDGTMVEVDRHGERHRIDVAPSAGLLGRWREPRPEPDADAIVVPRGMDSGGHAAGGTPRVIGPDALRDRLLFGVDPSTAGDLCREHLGCPARDPRWTEDDAQPISSRVTAGSVLGAVALAIGAALLMVAIGPAVLPGGGLGVADPTESGNSSSADAIAGSAPILPQPTCERGPGAVAMTVAEALEPPENGSSGMHVFWQFTDPEILETRHYRGFRGYYEGPRFEPLRQADEVILDHVVYTDEDARAFIIAPTDGGIATYVFTLDSTYVEGKRCWRIQSVEPA